MTKILAFSGSNKQTSFNKKLARVAARSAERAGAEVTLANIEDYPMPIFSEDIEKQGIPQPARDWKKLLLAHDGLLIASPEYNSSFSPLLKNAIDWASRSHDSEDTPLNAFSGKVAAILSTSPGALGGLRGLAFLRLLLSNIGVLVLPTQLAIGGAFSAFAEDGSLKDEKQQKKVNEIATQLVHVTASLHNT